MFKNWKTTSAGLTLIIGAVVTIVYSAKAGAVTQEVLMGAVAAVLGGVGLLFAKDSDAPTA